MKIDSILDEDFGSDLASVAYMNGVFVGEEIYQKIFGTEEKRMGFLSCWCYITEKWIQNLNLKQGGVAYLLQL